MKEEKVSNITILFAVSFWLLFITYDGSFSVQSVLPIIILGLLVAAKSSTYPISIKKNNKLLILFFMCIAIGCLSSMFFYNQYISLEIFTGLLYFFAIVVWYLLVTSPSYTKHDLHYIFKSYTAFSTVCSILIIMKSLGGAVGKISITNLIGTVTDENIISALISITPIYLFISIVNKKEPFSKKISKCILFFINIWGIAVTGSRGTLLATVLAIAISILLFIFQRMTAKKFITIVFIVILISFVGNRVIDLLPEWTYARYFNRSYNDSSNRERLDCWLNAFNGIIDKPFFGYGTGFFHNLPEYSYLPNGKRIPTGVPAHQTYLDIFIYSGLIGGFFFLLFLFNIFVKYLSKNKRIFLPILVDLAVITNIIGADKTVYLWNNVIILTLIIKYVNEGGECSDLL